MKIGNAFYLAKLNIKRNKHRTIRTVLGLSIGLILLISALFMIFAFRYGFLGYLENNRIFNSFNLRYGYNSKLTLEDIDEIKKYDGITSTINYRLFGFSKLNYNKIEYDVEIIIDDKTYDALEITMSAVDKIVDDEINQYSYEINNKPFIISGTSNVGEGEILISTGMLNYTNETAEEIVGKNISIKIPLTPNYYHDENGNVYLHEFKGEMKYLLKDFKVVGVYNQLLKTSKNANMSTDDETTYYGFENSGNLYNKMLPYGDNFIVNEKSLLDFNYEIEKVIVEKNIPNVSDPVKTTLYHYVSEFNPEYYQEEAIKNHKVNIAGKVFEKTYYTRVYFKNFDYSSRAYESIKDKYLNDENIEVAVNKWGITDIAINDDFVEFIVYHRIISNISYFLLFISIIIMFISILNIFNTIGYNIHKNEGYIGFMKALGLKNIDVFKVYISEFFIYLILSFIIAFIISISYSISMTIIVNGNFITSRTLGEFVNSKNINFGYYFLSFGIVILILGLISYMYTRIITRRVVKNKITTLLKK